MATPAPRYACDVCHDSGLVLETRIDPTSENADRLGRVIKHVPCPVCDGTPRICGEVEEGTQCATPNTTP